jgi:hypothetical protein
MQFSEVNNGTGREINEGDVNVFPLKRNETTEYQQESDLVRRKQKTYITTAVRSCNH